MGWRGAPRAEKTVARKYLSKAAIKGAIKITEGADRRFLELSELVIIIYITFCSGIEILLGMKLCQILWG